MKHRVLPAELGIVIFQGIKTMGRQGDVFFNTPGTKRFDVFFGQILKKLGLPHGSGFFAVGPLLCAQDSKGHTQGLQKPGNRTGELLSMGVVGTHVPHKKRYSWSEYYSISRPWVQASRFLRARPYGLPC